MGGPLAKGGSKVLERLTPEDPAKYIFKTPITPTIQGFKSFLNTIQMKINPPKP
jgi:hypothetical protein